VKSETSTTVGPLMSAGIAAQAPRRRGLSRHTGSRVGRVSVWGCWVLAAVCVGWTATVSGFQMTVLGTAMVFAAASVGVGLQLKTLKLLSLAQGAMLGIGAYGQLILTGRYHWDFLSALVVSVLIAAVVGIVLGLASVRVRTHYYILLTAAVQAIGAACMSGLVSLTGGAQGTATPSAVSLFGLRLESIKQLSILAAVVAVATALLADVIYRTAPGRRMIAAGSSPILARASGASVVAANIMGNVLMAVFGAVAGAVYAPLVGYLGPAEFALGMSITCVLVGVVSTRISFSLAIVAAVLLQELTQQLSDVGSVSGVIYGGIIVLVGTGLALGVGRSFGWPTGLFGRSRSGAGALDNAVMSK
jgi:branched-chain amino acid transport system permease protein